MTINLPVHVHVINNHNLIMYYASKESATMEKDNVWCQVLCMHIQDKIHTAEKRWYLSVPGARTNRREDSVEMS